MAELKEKHVNLPIHARAIETRINFKELEKQLVDDLYNVRTEIDREKEKQLSRIENNARAIINDKNLSERTKRYRLKQLLNSKAIEQDMTYQSFQFDNDPVVNGILWQEILNKPKQL